MKILALSYLFPNRLKPELGIFVLNRLKALARQVDIAVINPIAWSPIHRWLPAYRENENIPLVDEIGGLRVFHPRFLSIPGAFKSLEATTYTRAVRETVERYLRDFDFDIVDMHWTYPDLPAGLALSRAFNKPSIVTLRGREAFYREGGGRRAAMIVEGLKQANQVIALSQELADMAGQAIGSNDKIHVIRNGVDVGNFTYMPQAEARFRLGLCTEGRMILSVGALIRRKGFDLIINSLHRLRQRAEFQDLKLYIIGSVGPEGDYRAVLNKQIAQLGLADRVVFAGQVANAQLPLWYNAADLFCLASRGEGSPNVLSEALACGCPSVASMVGSVPDILQSETDMGLAFRNGDVDHLAELLVAALNATWDRRDIAETIRKYDWDWCARQVGDVYARASSSSSVHNHDNNIENIENKK